MLSVIFLTALLFFSTLPKDVIHLFADHKDTVHYHDYGKGGASLEEGHHHCSWIDLVVPAFAYTPFTFIPQYQELPRYTYFQAPVAALTFAARYYTSLRGPPVMA